MSVAQVAPNPAFRPRYPSAQTLNSISHDPSVSYNTAVHTGESNLLLTFTLKELFFIEIITLLLPDLTPCLISWLRLCLLFGFLGSFLFLQCYLDCVLDTASSSSASLTVHDTKVLITVHTVYAKLVTPQKRSELQ